MRPLIEEMYDLLGEAVPLKLRPQKHMRKVIRARVVRKLQKGGHSGKLIRRTLIPSAKG